MQRRVPIVALCVLVAACNEATPNDGGTVDNQSVMDAGALPSPPDGTFVFLPQRTNAIPIAVRDPTLNVWLSTARPTDDWPRAWHGEARPLSVLARVDGQPLRLFGLEPPAVAPAPIDAIEVRPRAPPSAITRRASRSRSRS